MNYYTIKLRSLLRKVGMLKLLSAIRRGFLPAGSYEGGFSSQMLSCVQPGDVVWDVGANLGLYTSRFLDKVGENGGVVCFEPAPVCFQILKKRFVGHRNVQLENVALGKDISNGYLHLASDPAGKTHRLENEVPIVGKNVVPVSITTGNAYLENDGRVPGVIKIDVEGFEEETLLGMDRVLLDTSLRAVFCEIHFAILEERGEAIAPMRIQKLLDAHGFETDWVDVSHLRAVRRL